MLALLGAFVAGVLTTLAPCVLPLLPVIVGGSLVPTEATTEPTAQTADGAGGVATRRRVRVSAAHRRALVITASLGASIILFTLLLKASTALIGVPSSVWQYLSGGLLVLLGLVSLFPGLWDAVSMRLGLQARTTKGLAAARGREGTWGAVLTGAALGPVFTSCSPLYGYVIVTVLPADLAQGLLLLVVYAAGLCLTLLAIALLGQRAVRGARWAADPHGWFRRGIGAVFIVVGLLVLTGVMKDLETLLVESSPWQPWTLDEGLIPAE